MKQEKIQTWIWRQEKKIKPGYEGKKKNQTWIWRQEKIKPGCEGKKKSNPDMEARKKIKPGYEGKKKIKPGYEGKKKSNLNLKARKNQTWMWRQASLGSREVIFLGRGTLSTWEHDYHDIIYVRWWSVVGWSNIMMAMLLIGRVTLAICEDNKLQPYWACIYDHERW